MSTDTPPQDNLVAVLCGARTVFWPDDEACEAECCLPLGHQPEDVHQDEILGEWRESELDALLRRSHDR